MLILKGSAELSLIVELLDDEKLVFSGRDVLRGFIITFEGV
jgi:hypothetical protein